MQRPHRQARRIGLLVAAAVPLGCANMEAPPGGPPDVAPPSVVSIFPDSGALMPDLEDDAVIRFNEVIEEMASGGRGGRGAGGLASLILLSPVEGDVRVRWKRSAIAVRPRAGWRQGVVYRLELRPGIQDLRRNTLEEGRIVLFSTGPDIPDTRVSGVAVDWEQGRRLAAALIDLRPAGDSVGYLAIADSVGTFVLGGIPHGRYVAYAIGDQNNDRRLAGREAYDSATFTLDSTAALELWAFPRDTTPPRVRATRAADSAAIVVETSQPLDPYQLFSVTQAQVLTLPDSTPLTVLELWRAAAYDSTVASSKAAADSAAAAERAAADTAAADSVVADTAAADTTPAPQAREARPGARRQGQPPRGQGEQPVDSLLLTRPRLSNQLVIELAEPWQPEGRYVVQLLGVLSAAGVTADTMTGVFAAPERTAEADTARADTARTDTPRADSAAADTVAADSAFREIR